MRGWSFVVILALVSTGELAAQSSVRPGGSIQGGPGRIVSPLPATPSPGVSTIQPGKPDARLGAGGVRPYTGNIVYPGTPGNTNPGNILSPGLPTSPATQPIPSIVQPPRDTTPPPTTPRGGGRHPHGRRFIGAYPIYGVYAYPMVPNVIEVQGSTVTRSGSGYVVNVGEEPAAPSEEKSAEDQEDPDYWLVALRGGLIYAVSGYVIEERAFRFVTLQGDEYVVPLAELDREFTVKLNRDRGVTIELD